MVTESVVADVAYTIQTNGQDVGTSSDNPQKQDTEVNGTRNNKFWNQAIFTDSRTGVGSRTLKICTEASGDIANQTPYDSVNETYEPPTMKSCSPGTTATMFDNGKPSHLIEVLSKFEIWDGDNLEYSFQGGGDVTVNEV